MDKILEVRKGKSMKKALVIASGGIDSTVAIYQAKQKCNEVQVLTFDYGANHNSIERKCLEKTCRALGLKLTTIQLPLASYFKSSLLSGPEAVPEGHWTDKSMKSTVVPFRNGIMFAFAAGFAESNGFDTIILGNHAGDHTIYPDCRPEFIDSIARAVKAGTWAGIEVVSPFCNMSKAQTIALGAQLGVDFKSTYSCYKGKEKHCGRCGTCVERKEAFIEAGIQDPTEYEEE